MDTAMQVLVIIVSATLTLFLLLAIVALIYLIKVLHALKRLTDKAEVLADKAGVVGEFIGRAAGPVAVGRLLTHVAESVFNHGKKDRKGSGNE
jgi:membrane protein implicated in regulation of membrane protease activity